MINEFDESEVPYDTLKRFGLTENMIQDLPEDILKNIFNGHRSPVLPIHVTLDDGEEVKARTRFALIRTEEGKVDVLFYPKLDEYDLSLFDDQQKQKLLDGKAIVGNKTDGGTSTHCFFQLDSENRQVLSVPTPVIGRNIQYISERYHLTSTEIQKIQNGEALTIFSEDEDTFTVGIDLNARTGIRFAAGDEETWKRESKRDYGKYKFGIFGCWVTDNDGNMDYVEENDYTDEMWNEQKKQGMRGLQR